MLFNTIYLAGIFTAGGITTAMVVHLWLNRKIIEPDLSILLLAGLWVWIAGQIGECVFITLAVKIIFYKIKFLGISLVCSSWLCFCLQFMGGKKRFFSRLFILLFILPFLFNILSFFGYFETAFWKALFLSPNNLLLDIEPNIGYVIYNIYGVILIVAGFLVFMGSAILEKSFKKLRLLPFLFCAILSTIAGVADFIFRQDLFYYRFLPIALSLSSLMVIYYLRLRYFRTIPLAQHVVVESMDDCMIILSPDNDIVYINPAAYPLFSGSPIDVIGKPLAKYLDNLTLMIEQNNAQTARHTIVDFAEKTFDVRLSPIRNRRGTIVNKVFVLRDITPLKQVEGNLREMKDKLEMKVEERTKELEDINEMLKAEIRERERAEGKIKASLDEKSVLLGELHHRVKNNLQIVSSLLKLQSRFVGDEEARELFDLSISRIRSIAMVHEMLYKSRDIARVDFGDYIHELVHSIIFSHSNTSEHIKLDLAIEPVHLDIDTSILAGLIINELVINSLKYAFPEERLARNGGKNEITIEFKSENSDFILVVSDNGKGLPPDFTIEKSESLGMKIVLTLAKQLKGRIEFVPCSGSKILIRFPKPDNDRTSA
jgi:PAS domain S-box-containing protein